MLTYTGSFIEEFVEKEKLEMYFSWLKNNNHLYKDINLDTNLIDQFISESQSASDEFESMTKEDTPNISLEVQNCVEESIEVDVMNSMGNDNPFEAYEGPEIQSEKRHDQTTIWVKIKVIECYRQILIVVFM